MTLVHAVFLWSIYKRNQDILEGGDNLARILIIFMMLTVTNAYFEPGAKERRAKLEERTQPSASALRRNHGVHGAVCFGLIMLAADCMVLRDDDYRSMRYWAESRLPRLRRAPDPVTPGGGGVSRRGQLGDNVKLYRVWELLIVASICSLIVALSSGTKLLESLAGWLMGMAGLLVVAGFARGRLRQGRVVLAARANADAPRGQRLAHRIVAEAGPAGASVVIVQDGAADWGSAGESGRRGLALDRATRFEIGSLTKVFTGLLLADSVVRGEVGLEDPLGRYLPGIVADPAGTVTLRSLATHTSGLPRLPRSARLYSRALIKSPDPYRGLDRRWLNRVGPVTPAQQRTFSYSNFGYMLLGEALAEAAGQSWADLVSERICSVLAMTATSVFPDAHTARGHNNFSFPTSYWHSSALPGAGALYSNTADLWRFLAAQLDPKSTALGAAIRLSRQPHAPNIGLGWMLNMSTGVAWHNGGTGGFGAFMAVSGGSNAALAALTNSYHTRKLDRVAMECLREMTKKPVR